MSFFTYQLPPEKIAQRPIYPYDHAKLLVIDRKTSVLKADVFYNITEYFNSKDLIVFNDTAVRPSRLFGQLDSGGQVELLLLKSSQAGEWWCLARPLRKLIEGKRLFFANNLEARVVTQHDQQVLLKFNQSDQELKDLALMPIPPYIRKGHGDDQDVLDYQTIFAKVEGSVAAPTASLHFTPGLVAKIQEAGVELAYLTLHVGTASFLPLQYSDQDHPAPPGSEDFQISEELIAKIINTKARGGRVIAVGTTAIRALESCDLNAGPTAGATKLFIQPGYQFKNIDVMVTNFHQPNTTHLMLVQAFLGLDLISKSYDYALANNFRFLSYGDGMICL